VIFEVFRQEKKGQAFQHAGSIDAPDAAFAETWAREQYGRRGESEALWLVARDEVHEVSDFPDEFDLKYRRVDGYSLKVRLKEARERASLATRSDAR
jgi:phenylacetate-CoA oxygenase PaaH subunit